MIPSPTPVSGDAMPIDDVIARLRDIAATRSEDGTWYAANGGKKETTTEWIAADLLERLRSQGGAPEGPSRTEQVLEDARTAIKIYDGVLALKARVATEFARGVDAAVKIIDGKVADYTSEHGSLDPETGVMEFSRSGEEYVSTLEELAEEIRTSLATGAVQPPEGGTGWGSSALSDVASERQRQISAEGWDAAHDDAHDEFEMSRAAAFYCLHTAADILPEPDVDAPSDRCGLFLTADNAWPENWSRHLWKKPKDARRNLVRAAALIIADIERLDRKALPSPPGQDDRTNDGSETDGSLNQSALPRKDVEGAE